MNILTKTSPNQNERQNNVKASMLILHYTGTQTMEEADCIYMTPDRVSPHYMIDRDGSVIQYVGEDKRAWHAGKSSWNGETDINSVSIGIEIVNGGHEFGLEEFPKLQIRKLIELINDIRTRWEIPNHRILGHSDIAPGRKIDPGEKFPWDILYKAGIGLMPGEGVTSGQIDTPIELYAALKDWGYDYTEDINIIVQEFMRHYLPEDFSRAPDFRKLYVAIYSLIEQKNNISKI